MFLFKKDFPNKNEYEPEEKKSEVVLKDALFLVEKKTQQRYRLKKTNKQKTKYFERNLMLVVWFVIFVLLFATCLAAFISVMVRKPRVKVVPPPIPVFSLLAQDASGLTQSFNQSDGSIFIQSDNKPLLTTTPIDTIAERCFLFYNFESKEETIRTSRGFTFAVNVPVNVISLQVIDQLLSDASSVGIYDVAQGTLLCTAVVSKTSDFLLQGFRTHPLELKAQASLVPNTLYACVALVHGLVGPSSPDFYVTNSGWAFNASTIFMDASQDEKKLGFGQVGSIASNTLTLPTSFSPFSLMSPFASFEFQQKRVMTNVFEVDTQYARFPPEYIYGVNPTTMSANQVSVSSGFCTSSNAMSNILVPVPLTLTVGNLTADTFYAVYVAVIGTVGNSSIILLSPNFLEVPLVGPRQRRVGWARTQRLSTDLFLMHQTGNGTSRVTFYDEPAMINVLTNVSVPNNTIFTAIVPFVPPTASEVTLQFEANVNGIGTGGFSFDINNITTVTFYDQSYQVQTISVPITNNSRFAHLPFPVLLQFHTSSTLTVVTLNLRVMSFTEDT